MASGVTRISDVVVPEIFTPYTIRRTAEKSRLVQSGALVVSPALSALLNGGGLTFNEPFFKDLDNDEENTSSDDPAVHSTPNKIGTGSEIEVRLSRNNSWSSMDLTAALAGVDPMSAIGDLVADYWVRRLQRAFIATQNGVYANNALATDANHTQNDMTRDISALAGDAAKFSAEAVIDATLTMGDSMQELTLVTMHSLVFGTAQKNNLIDFIPDSRGEILIPTFLGREVLVDDGLPFANGVFQTWFFGGEANMLGQGSPATPTEVDRDPTAGNGGGQDVLHNRVEWAIHPVGHAYIGAPGAGGPTNASTSDNLANANSWKRVFPERKQIKMARLITKEY